MSRFPTSKQCRQLANLALNKNGRSEARGHQARVATRAPDDNAALWRHSSIDRTYEFKCAHFQHQFIIMQTCFYTQLSYLVVNHFCYNKYGLRLFIRDFFNLFNFISRMTEKLLSTNHLLEICWTSPQVRHTL